jgi:hypothetical protein
MSSLIAAFLLAVAPADEAAVKEVAALAQKVKDAESYTFEYVPMAHSSPAAKPAADGAAKKAEGEGDDDKDPVAWKVEIQKKSPWHYQHGEVELFRHEMQFVMKNKEGKWMRIGGAPNANRGPAASAGGAPPKGEDDGDDGKDGKKPEGGEKGGKQNRRGPARAIAAAVSVPLVHQIFNEFEKKVTDVTKDAKPAANGEVVYVATLTPAAARELTNEGRGMRLGHADGHAPGKAGGGEGKEPNVAVGATPEEASATVRIAVKDGAIASVAIDATTKTPGGEHRSGGRITLSNLNATKIVVPPEAQAALAGPQAPHEGGAPEKK